MPDDQTRTQRHLEDLKSLGLSEGEAKELIDSESCFYNDLIIIDRLHSVEEGQERLAKSSRKQNLALIGLTIVIAILTAVLVAGALHWL